MRTGRLLDSAGRRAGRCRQWPWNGREGAMRGILCPARQSRRLLLVTTRPAAVRE